MFGILIGAFGTGFLSRLFKKERFMFGGGDIFENNKYVDFLPNQGLIDSVKYHEAGSKKAIEKAYRHSNEKQYTIGFGTSYLYTGLENGFKPFMRKGTNGVRYGDSLTSLKKEMGYSRLSNDKFAEQLVYNYFRGSGTYNRVARHLDDMGVKFSIPLAHSLMELSYGTSCAFYLTKLKCNSATVIAMYKNFLNVCKQYENDEKRLALECLKFRVNYIRRLSAFKKYKRGWLIRSLVVYLNAIGVISDVISYLNAYQADMSKFKKHFKGYTGLDYDKV